MRASEIQWPQESGEFTVRIEWRVWRNGSVTVFQTEGAGSIPATRTNKEDR